MPVTPSVKAPGDLKPGDVVDFRGHKHVVTAGSPTGVHLSPATAAPWSPGLVAHKAAASAFAKEIRSIMVPGETRPKSGTQILAEFPPRPGETPAAYRQRLRHMPVAPNFVDTTMPRPGHGGHHVQLPGSDIRPASAQPTGEPRVVAPEHLAPEGDPVKVRVSGTALSPEEAKLRTSLGSGISDEWGSGEGAQADTAFLKTKDGVKVVRKEFHDWTQDPSGGGLGPGDSWANGSFTGTDLADAEFLSGQVADAIGGTGAAPALRGESPAEVYLGYAEGGLPYIDGEPDMGGDRAMRIGLLDYLADNSDRHPANFLVDDNGQPVPIDESSTFGIPGGGSQSPFLDTLRESISNEDTPIPPGEAAKISKRLDAIKPAFTDAGRGDWYQQMMTRWDLFTEAQKASDGGSLILPHEG